MEGLSAPPSPEPLTAEGNNIKSLLDELEDSMDGDVGQIKRQFMSRIMPEDEEFNSSQVPIDTVTKRDVQDMIDSIPKPVVQKPFQPGSSPADEDNRFLCWNNTGIIRAQSQAEDQGIDVMFHDTEKHSSVNFKNEPNYTFGSLSEDCIIVGTNGKYGTGPASIHGINLLETDRDNREWEVELPHVELIEALAAGLGFVAVVTDQRNLRLFTNAGMQSYIFALPNQILCMTATGNQLMTLYHNGAGHSDDQNLSMNVYRIDLFNNSMKQTHSNVPVALSKRSPLSWAGFSDEGTPCTYDYNGMLRMYRHELGKCWIPILDLRDLTTSALDHYFLVGVNEMAQTVRAVKCKRSRFPDFSTETAEMLAFSLPLCSMDTDKGRLEEEHVRLRLAELAYERMVKSGGIESNHHLIESAMEANEKLLVNNVLRLFAICLKEDKEDMAKKLVYMIPKAHMGKLAEFAWKINRPQYFIDQLNEAIEEREKIDFNLANVIMSTKQENNDEEEEIRSVTSSHHNFGKDLRRELNKQESPNKLKPLPLDKLAANNINRLIEISKSNKTEANNNKRNLDESSFDDNNDSGDENDVKRATKRSKGSSINYNLFSKKPRA